MTNRRPFPVVYTFTDADGQKQTRAAFARGESAFEAYKALTRDLRERHGITGEISIYRRASVTDAPDAPEVDTAPAPVNEIGLDRDEMADLGRILGTKPAKPPGM